MAQIRYGTEGSENLPLSQQSFGEPRKVAAHAAPPAPTFVPGLGTLGADLGGYVKGDMLAQEYVLNENKDARAEEELGLAKEDLGVKKDYVKIAQADLGIRLEDLSMRKEKFSWDREAYLKEKIMQEKITAAADSGGYEGVIEYLKKADPQKAISFHAQKLALDGAIMQNDVMKAQQPNNIGKAMIESYSILGKMGAGVLNAKPEERQKMLDTMQPMLQKILGDKSPKTLEEAAPIFMLGVAQATPENTLFKAKGEATKSGNSLVQLNEAINEKLKNGSTPENDPGLKTMIEARETYSVRYQNALAQKANTELQMKSKEQQNSTQILNNTRNLVTDLNKGSKDFNDYLGNYASLKGAFDALEKDPTNTSAQGAASTILASMVQKGVLTDPDFLRIARNNAGLKYFLENKMEALISGKEIVMAPDEIANLKSVFEEVTKAKVAGQKAYETQFLNATAGKGDVIDKDMLSKMLPSVRYDNMQSMEQLKDTIVKYGLEKYPQELQIKAAKAIEGGPGMKAKNPAAVKQLLDNMMKQQGQANGQ